VELSLTKMAYVKRAVQAPAHPADPEKKPADATSTGSTPAPPIAAKPTPPVPTREALSPPAQDPEPKPEVPKPTPPPQQPSGKLNSKLRLQGSGPLKLDAYDKAVQSEVVEEARSFESLSLEEFTTAWKKYTDTLESEYTKSVLSHAELSLDKDKVIVTVTSSHAQNTIQEENQLMEALRKDLKVPDLQWEVREDKSKQPVAPPPKKKILRPKEKYLLMRDNNPLLTKMRDRFDLAPDEE
ncbi:MAG: hypothetical protein KDC44_22725, partial [Phaeodactylibacter sp.]|nr:hypothetical protein [Phaeodactylibacter sp.]